MKVFLPAIILSSVFVLGGCTSGPKGEREPAQYNAVVPGEAAFANAPLISGTKMTALTDIFWPIGGQVTSVSRPTYDGYNSLRCYLISHPTPGERTQRVLRKGRTLVLGRRTLLSSNPALASLFSFNTRVTEVYPATAEGNATVQLVFGCVATTYGDIKDRIEGVLKIDMNAAIRIEEINYEAPKQTVFDRPLLEI